MKRRLSALLLMLLIALPRPVFAEEHGNREEILARIDQERARMIANMRLVIENGYILNTKAPSGFVAAVLGDSNPDLARHRRMLEQQSRVNARTESEFRQVISAEIIAATRGMSKQEATAYLVQRSNDISAVYARSRSTAQGVLVDRLRRAGNDEERAKAYAHADGLMRTVQLEEEMVQAALRRNGGQDDFARMRELARRASGTRVSLRNTDIADDDEREAEIFVRKARVEAQISEYRRLAQTGRLVNPNTGQLEEGPRRIAMAEDAERALATEMQAKALKPNSYDILRWMIPETERAKQSAQIRQSIADTPEYTALDFLGTGAGSDQSQHFLALAQAVRKQSTGVNDWRAGFVKGTDATGVSAIDETVNVIRTGTADFNRILGTAGEMSLDRVDARIARYQTEVDSVTNAFTEAARLEREAAAKGLRGNPADLDTTSRALLKKHGYVVGNAGEERFVIPTGTRSLGGLKNDLNLPGDHLLNAISGQNMLEIALTSYIPGATAGKVGTLLEGLNVGTRGVRAATFATDLAAGVVLDSGLEYAKTGKVDPARIAIEATMLQSTLGTLGKATGGVSKQLTDYISQPGVRRAAETSLTQALGLTSEAALQSYYQSAVSGQDMSYDTFLANMLNGAMSRGMSRVIEGPAVAGMPEGLRGEIDARQAAVNQSRTRAAERLKAVLGDDLVQPSGRDGQEGLSLTPGARAENITKVMDDALNSGAMTWSELKLLYADNKGLEPLLKAVNERRTQYFSDIVKPAQRMAEADLNAEYVRESERIEAEYADDPAALQAARQRHQNAYDAELALIRTDPRSPGSGNLTSDVDRSIASERVRKKLKEIYRGDNENFEIPATSAQSYDVNEYIDVFPVINKTMPLSDSLAGLDVPDGDFQGLQHEQATQAQGYATAMLHMNGAQRAKYRENVLAGASDTELATRQLDLATKSLDRADLELKTEMDRVAAENPNLSANPSDLAIRARDNLYGRRTEAIRTKATEMLHVENEMAALREKGVDDASPEMQALIDQRNAMAADIQRDWGYTLREGIETYASFTGLDAVVNDGQIPKDASIRKLINDDGYVRLRPGESADGIPEGATVKRLSDAQVENFLNDQVMMMTHHANGFHEGNEGVIDAGSAIGKYAERTVLALKMQGKDLSKPPYDVLNKLSEELVANRKDPEKLREVLTRIGRQYGGDASPETGLLQVMKMVQDAVPQTRGLWDPKTMGLAPAGAAAPGSDSATPMRRIKTQLANRRRLLQDEEETLRRSGPASAAQANQLKQQRLTDELSQLNAQKERRKRLGSRYLKKDWEEAEALEAKDRELKDRIERVRALRGGLQGGDPLYKELQENSAKLRKLQQDYADAGGTGLYTPDETDARIDARIARIQEEQALREKAGERYKALEAEAAERRANAPAVPDGEEAEVSVLDASGVDLQTSGQLTVTLNGVTVSIPVLPLPR